MVRKRVHAQKSLSPTKEILANSATPLERQVSNEQRSGDKNGMLVNDELKEEGDGAIMDGGSDGINLSFCDDLPGFDSFDKELSEKSKGYWNSLQQDYNDFTSWTCLLQAMTESENNLPAAEAVFRCFLRYYPYCYGYWKKFADIEKKHGMFDRAEQVFKNGVKSISISIDLWVHYVNFTVQQKKDVPNGDVEIRNLFNSAIDAAGMEFKSNKLWDAYIHWERSLGNLKKITEIYDRLIKTPNHQYIKNWQKFKEHLENNAPADILSTEEYMKTMHELDIVAPGLTSEALNSSSAEDDSTVRKNAVMIQKKVIAKREQVFLQTAAEIKKRWKYEESIKRPYFHIKPLEKSQLKNWKDYLDFEGSLGDHKQIVFLFERCMVVCALYEEFWQKYLDYIEHKDPEATRVVYSRACGIHLRKKYPLHIKWAVFEERQNKYDSASNILSNLDKNFPGMILITQHRVGIARRMKRYDEIEGIYENAIKSVDRIEDKVFYSIKLSHVLAKFCGDKSKARLVLLDALKLGKKQKRLYLQLLDLEMHYGTVEDDHVLSLFNSVENDLSLSDEERNLFNQRKVEFYEEYCNDIQAVMEVRENFNALPSEQTSKRKLSDISMPESPIKSKKSVEKPVGQSPMAAAHIPMPDASAGGYNPENPGIGYDSHNQSFYNWDQQFQQYQNYTHQ